MGRDRAVVCAQNVASDAGGIATCARLTILALKTIFKEVVVLAAQDFETVKIEGLASIPFGKGKVRFVARSLFEILRSDFVMYDFAGTARIHSLLGPINRPSGVWAHGWEIWPANIRRDHSRALQKMAIVFTNSAHTANVLQETVPDLSSIRPCWLGTEDERVSLGVKIHSCEEPNTSKTMLFIGRNDELFAKGQDILIDVWPQVVAAEPQARLEFIGGGCNLERLRTLVARSPVHTSLRVWGPLDDNDLFENLDRARALIHLSEVEGFGLVTVEAMRRGKPAIVSTNDASCEIVSNAETGFAVAREDRGAIVAAILKLLNNQTLYANMSAAAHDRWRREFSQASFVTRFTNQLDAAQQYAPLWA